MNFDSPQTGNVSIFSYQNQQYSRYKGYLKWELLNGNRGFAIDAIQTTPESGLQRERQSNSFIIPSLKSGNPSASPSVAHEDSHEHVCCEKLDDLSQQYQLIINEQMDKLAELNLLIQQHTILLIDSYNKGFEESKGQSDKETNHYESNVLLKEKERQIKEWQDKYNEEKKLGLEKEHEIKELEKHIKELSSQVTVTTNSTTLQDEANTWKNKFITLNKQFNEAEQKLVVVENEIDMLKQQQKKVTTSETRANTRRRTTVKEVPPQE